VLLDPHNAIHNAHLGDVYYTLGTMHCTSLHCVFFDIFFISNRMYACMYVFNVITHMYVFF
jgi:hypothetical protein